MDEKMRSLALGLSVSGILHPGLDRAVRDYHKAEHYLIQFTQGKMWTESLRATAWERATKLRAQTVYPMTMPNALAAVIQRMEEQYPNKRGIHMKEVNIVKEKTAATPAIVQCFECGRVEFYDSEEMSSCRYCGASYERDCRLPRSRWDVNEGK